MERALEILKVMLASRGLDIKEERITADGIENANLYKIGDITVIFSQKGRGLLERDIRTFLKLGFETGMIIVTMAPPSENVLKFIKTFAKERVQLFHLRQLQFDITTHRYAAPHRILKEDEKRAIFDQYKISKPEDQLPWIDSQDAMVKWIGAVPGDVIEVIRHSDVAGRTPYYRYCVEDVNVA
jgi:DNA-directed RNA polymerase subunit H (RpoH/RPB5)